MSVFFDTSVLIAAFWGDHAGHDASLALFARATRETAACGVHSLAELYSVMSGMPRRPPIASDQVLLFIDDMRARLAFVVLGETDYLETIRHLGESGFRGGRIYDALLLACARKCNAETIYTWDVRHFVRIAPDLADRIRTP